jgi:hypothetical protein
MSFNIKYQFFFLIKFVKVKKVFENLYFKLKMIVSLQDFNFST